MELLPQILTIIATMLGIPAGMVIAGMCKEELKAGRKWFSLVSFFSIIAILVAITWFSAIQEIAFLPALLMVLIMALGIFIFRKALFFYFSVFALILMAVFWVNSDSFIFYICSFSFIFLISITSYAYSFKRKKLKKGSKR